MTNLLSFLVGSIASYEFPKGVQIFLNKAFLRITKINLEGFLAVDKYRSIQALFTRTPLISFEFDTNKEVISSPAEALISEFGKIKENVLLQIKGQSYLLEDLLTDKFSKSAINTIKNGEFMNFYLAPFNYHHFHAPCDFKIQKIVHVPGKLFSVSLKTLKKRRNVFCINERVIIECKNKSNQIFYFVAVGATNVGKIKIFKEKKLETNCLKAKKTVQVFDYTKKTISIKKGEDLGCFEMGSTVVLLFPPNVIDWTGIEVNQSVLCGETIAKLK